MMKKQLGIVLLVLFGLTISSCSGGGKYIFFDSKTLFS